MPDLEWNLRWGKLFQKAALNKKAEDFGRHWGDPELKGLRYFFRRYAFWDSSRPIGPLYKVVDRYIEPFIDDSSTVLEIGPGSGRWTKYMLSADRLILVDLSPVFLTHLAATLTHPNLDLLQADGYTLRGVPSRSVDFVFSFGTFVTMERSGVASYLGEIARVLRSGGVCVVQYADATKPKASRFIGFECILPDEVESMLRFPILQHDRKLFDYCSILVGQAS